MTEGAFLHTTSKSRVKPWKPSSLSPYVLLTFLSFSLIFVAVLEVLSWINRRQGAIAFANSQGDFAPVTVFAYLYLPTILAVVYSNVWSWVDLDVKRLEPYFQMSKEGGATSGDSLFLHYPFEFIAFAPLRALKRGQVPLGVGNS